MMLKADAPHENCLDPHLLPHASLSLGMGRLQDGLLVLCEGKKEGI